MSDDTDRRPSAASRLLGHASSSPSRLSIFGQHRSSVDRRASIIRRQRNKWMRTLAFTSSMMNCLCAGSILLYSLYAPIFQQKLHYKQLEVNAVSIAGELGMYLPVPIFGYICDKYGPGRLSVLSTFFFTPGYLMASYAFTHRQPYGKMTVAFLLVGAGTSSMYLSAVTTCAKNFTKRRGLALALPIAAFGLSSLWLSQLATSVFYCRDGSVGDSGGREVDVPKLFIFLAALLLGIGMFGGVALGVYPDDPEDDLILHGEVEPLIADVEPVSSADYGTTAIESSQTHNVITPSHKNHKGFLNPLQKAFLSDPTMWWFAAGVLLVMGPGEAFINNMGSVVHSINPADTKNSFFASYRADPAFHVSIIALTSTVARLTAGLLSDYLAPPATPADPDPDSLSRSISSLTKSTFHVSRIYFLTFFAFLMISAHFLLASGFIQSHPSLFWIISSFLGTGYGAIFTLAPTVVSVVWGVEGFGFNWSFVITFTAGGATLFGLIYASIYDNEAQRQGDTGTCWGSKCYSESFYIMGASVSCAVGLWLWAWKGKGGWQQRGIVV